MNAKWTAAATAIVGVLALWPQAQPFVDWFLSTSGNLLQRPVVHAVITAIAVGVLVAAFIPHIPLPHMDRLEPNTTKALTRTVAVVVSFLVAYRLQAPSTGKEQEAALIFSTLAAGTTSALWTTFAGFLYRFKARPESLK